MSFTAQDIKNFVLGDEEQDEYGNGDWGRLTWKRIVPNPNYDEAEGAEAERLNTAWRAGRGGGRSEAYDAWTKYTREHPNSAKTIAVDWTYTCSKGREFPITVIQDESGGEGHGEEAWLVFSVGDRIFRVDGSYYSYDGTHWDDDSFREVKAVTKAVTFYE